MRAFFYGYGAEKKKKKKGYSHKMVYGTIRETLKKNSFYEYRDSSRNLAPDGGGIF